MRIVTDGGALAYGYSHDDNNCSVVAVSIALGINYEEAWTKLDSAGRQKNAGFYIVEFFKHCNFKGYEAIEKRFKKGERLTHKEFAKKYSKGSWIVYTKGHVVAIKDGIIYDNRKSPNKNGIRYAWQIKKI